MSISSPLIVHVVYRFGPGGLENGIVSLINHMPSQRWRHAVVALSDVSAEFAARIVVPGVRCIALSKRPGHLIRDYPRLYRLFRELQPSIVHTRNLAALEAVVPARAAGVPVRIHGEHGWDMRDPVGKRRRYRLVRKAYRPFVNRYVVLSRHLEDYMEQQVGVDPQYVDQIYNGVDTERFHPSMAGRVVIPGCPFTDAEHWLVGSVGRMDPVKDPVGLARAFVRARTLDPVASRRLRLIMVGDGPLQKEVRSVLGAAGVADLAWFPGERDDVQDIMRGLDCFALPSLAEGVSNTILEAMASGLPVVATRVGGNSELIESGMTGTLVPASNPDALAQAILGYATDRRAARRHAKAARRDAEARFSLKRMVAEYARMYERTLAVAGSPVPPADDDPADSSGPPEATALRRPPPEGAETWGGPAFPTGLHSAHNKPVAH